MGRWHAHAARRAGGTVVAVADPALAAAQRVAGEDARAYASLDALLAAESPEVLHVCTPLETHAALTRQALEAGLHVLVEKPLTPDADEAARLLGEAQARGLLVCPVHQFPFQDGVRKALGQRPRLGEVLGFDAVFHSAGAEGQSAAGPDAVVADILPHPLSLMQALLPDGAEASGWHTVHPRVGELAVSAVQREVTIALRISMGSRPPVARLRLYGTEGTAHLDLFHGYAFFESGRVSRARKIAAPFDRSGRDLAAALGNLGRRIVRWEPAYPGLGALVRSFYRAVRGEGEAPFTAEEIVEVARVRDRLIGQAGGLPQAGPEEAPP